ncbi:replication protein A 70 kDa DNA-binding subunit B [Triticum aestivum]|uniref:replication protein A 70 kDa DNA-binding subunit B n=1 Tax=Triticum aestivum TaxID=4565 RepID=UPI001D011A45|nr:replication protein A 70 kDa DNA-binding subunit B-like [Triticum aestivum]
METLEERAGKDTQCSDVIGLLTKMKPVETRITKKSPQPSYIREIEILMPEGDKIRITLWGKFAYFLTEDVIGSQTVIIITSTMVQRFNGLCLKSTSATRIYIDLDIPEAQELLERDSTQVTLPKMMSIDRSNQGTLEEQMFYKRRTLQELTKMRHENRQDQDFVFTTIATVDRLQENIQWWYMSCDNCPKMVIKETDKYYCKSCGIYPKNVTPRYRIRLQISDHTSTTSCTLFDEEAARLLNTSASDLLDSLDGKTEEAPKIIQQLCGKKLIFRFKLSDSNLTFGTQNYAVKRTFVPDDRLEMLYLNDKAEEVKVSLPLFQK